MTVTENYCVVGCVIVRVEDGVAGSSKMLVTVYQTTRCHIHILGDSLIKPTFLLHRFLVV